MPTTRRSGGSTQPTLKRQGSPTAGSASKRPRNSRKTTGGQGRSRRGKKTALQPANMAKEEGEDAPDDTQEAGDGSNDDDEGDDAPNNTQEPGDDPGMKRAHHESAR